MNDKKKLDSDSFLPKSSWSESPKQRAEVQQNLKDQLQALKSLQEQVKQTSDAEKADHKIMDQLLSLEDRIQQLDQLKQGAFDIQAEKIKQELDVLKASLKDQVDLKNKIYANYSNLSANIKNKLSAHNPQTIPGRADAANRVRTINYREWENRIANLMARVIWRLNTKI